MNSSNKEKDLPEYQTAQETDPEQNDQTSGIVPKSCEAEAISSCSLSSVIPKTQREISDLVNSFAHDMNQALTVLSGGVDMLKIKSQKNKQANLDKPLTELRENIETLIEKAQENEMPDMAAGLSGLLSEICILDEETGVIDEDLIEMFDFSYKKLRRLVNQFRVLAIAAIQRRKNSLTEDVENLPPIDIGEILNNHYICRKILHKDSITFNVNLPEEIFVWGCAEEIDRILDNIFANAARAIEETGENNGTITVSVTVDNHYAYILISDNGIGIDPESRPNIFSKGFSTKESAMNQGIGLYYSRERAETIKGTLELHDKSVLSEHFENTSENGALAILKLKLAK